MTETKDLFDDTLPPYVPRDAHQLVRPTDPSTSHLAATKVVPKLRKIQQDVYDAMLKAGAHGMTDYELQEHFNNHGATYRTRRSELTEMGLVYDTGFKRVCRGTLRTIWAATVYAKGSNK